jgi:RNA polymerase sigma factor (sigma-70 family)
MPTSPVVTDIEQYRAPLTRYVHYLVRDATEAEDLAQETLLRAHRQQDSLRDPAALESWLYRIATHISIDVLRHRARTVQHHVDTPVEQLPIPGRVRSSPFNIVQQQEMSDCVQRYVAALSDEYKSVLLLHDADGLTSNEIAHLLELPLSTVKMRLHRARRKLQAALNNACAFGHDDSGVFICEPRPAGKPPAKSH